MKRKVSISIGELQEQYGDREALRLAKEMGADAVDFNTCGRKWDYRNPDSVYSKSDDEICSYYADLRKYADSIGLEIGQTHGQIKGFIDKTEDDEALIANGRIDCMAASALGAPYVVMHSVTTIFMGPDCPPEKMRNLNADMFCRLIPFAKKYGVKIASETFGDATGLGCCDFFGNINEFIKSFNRVRAIGDNADWLTTCVDTGHSNKATRYNVNLSPADVIRLLGPNVSALHLNDNDTLTDQHKIPMTGTIDWNDVFDALDEINYQGTYNMELNLCHFGKKFAVETAAFAVKVMRFMLDERYGKN